MYLPFSDLVYLYLVLRRRRREGVDLLVFKNMQVFCQSKKLEYFNMTHFLKLLHRLYSMPFVYFEKEKQDWSIISERI
jgi:hypothetical protein